LLPTGGQDHGHKGYGLALLVEALSQGLSGYGRANAEKRWGASVYVQVFDPAVFAGVAEFAEQTSTLVALCHGSRPHPNVQNVRVPGEQALARKRQALAEGIVLFDGVFEQLLKAAREADIVPPSSV
jgi:LDH2 family malate/lactate/ureidoglycolate dehydrogenase